MKAPKYRDAMMPEAFYLGLDAGIRFAVRVLHAAGGIETCQSCQGGKGHAYDRATVDLIASSDDAVGFRALAALQDFRLPVQDLALLWNVRNGLPYERIWRVTFTTPMLDRVDDRPGFVHSYRAI